MADRLAARCYPSHATDAAFRRDLASFLRFSASPGAARVFESLLRDVDIRVLPAIPVLRSVERFFAAAHGAQVDFDPVLATVLFTDVVSSTEAAARMGDRAWQDLIAAHQQRVRSLLARFRGREVDVAGDGSSPSSTGPPVPCTAVWRSATTPERSASTCASEFTAAKSSLTGPRFAASLCTSARAWRRTRHPVTCSCQDGQGPRRRLGARLC
jgi:class 3 adenylate cyclase